MPAKKATKKSISAKPKSPRTAAGATHTKPARATKEKATKKTTMPATKSTGAPAKKSAAQAKGKYYYYFGDGKADGSADMKDLLGGKGANLAEMSRAGVPVPPGFTITTEVCNLYYDNNLAVPKEIDRDLETYIGLVEKSTGKKFGNPADPLLVSVRSGAKFSMPGMMDTVLNLGLTAETVEGLAKKTGSNRFAFDVYRRFISMFGNVVLGIDKDEFEEVIGKKKKEKRIKQDSSLQEGDLRDIIKKFKSICKRKSGEDFPEDPWKQLRMARDAVFRSWNNPRAISYRRMHDIPSDLGTAVNIQAMVFGNIDRKSVV